VPFVVEVEACEVSARHHVRNRRNRSRRSRERECRPGDDLASRVSRSRPRGDLDVSLRPLRARPSSALDHRSHRRGAAAHGRRRARPRPHLQRRNLQLPRAPRAPPRARPSVRPQPRLRSYARRGVLATASLGALGDSAARGACALPTLSSVCARTSTTTCSSTSACGELSPTSLGQRNRSAARARSSRPSGKRADASSRASVRFSVEEGQRFAILSASSAGLSSSAEASFAATRNASTADQTSASSDARAIAASASGRRTRRCRRTGRSR
jgi:hypothetical protein